MYIRTIASGLLISSVLAFPAYSQTPAQTVPVQAVPAECNAVNISVNFAFEGATSANAKNELDDRLFKLNGFLLQNHMDRLETQSMSYKIVMDQPKDTRRPVAGQPPSPPPARVYRLTGTAEYQIDSSDNAFKIGQFLTQQKFEVTVSNKPPKNVQCNPPPLDKKPVATTTPVAPATQPNNALTTVLKAKPPGLQPDPSTDMPNQKNGATPDLPNLYQEPPEAVPLQGR